MDLCWKKDSHVSPVMAASHAMMSNFHAELLNDESLYIDKVLQ